MDTDDDSFVIEKIRAELLQEQQMKYVFLEY